MQSMVFRAATLESRVSTDLKALMTRQWIGTSRMMIVLTIVAVSLIGCMDGRERPFLMAQVCVRDKAGMVELVDALKAIAAEKRLRFADNTAAAQRDLKTVGYADRDRADGSPALNVAVERHDGLGVGATNLGLPGYQVALGFTEGTDKGETERFTNDVIATIEKHWVVERLPAETRALPKPGCR